MATHTPTHMIYLALPTKTQKPDGKSKAQWRRIGAVWKNKNLGASITLVSLRTARNQRL
jgi:hypothetical protein